MEHSLLLKKLKIFKKTTMKKIYLVFMVLVNCVFASDELNIDSLFKKQIGLRSITSFSLLSTGNANSYSLYPNITIGGDPTI